VCGEPFTPLRELFEGNLDAGLDIGGALAVTRHGQLVVDLWGGHLDPEGARAWERDTIVNIFSASKIPVAIAVLMLWDRGALDIDAPIARYWPEFAQAGKQHITARQVLCHRSGLVRFGRYMPPELLHDWDGVVAVLERASPVYEPGTVSCYHNLTFGFILGELVHRCSGSPFDEFVRREITGPLGADLHFSITAPETRARVSDTHDIDISLKVEPGSALERAMSEMASDVPWTDPERQAAVMPGAGGTANGRALAQIGAILACGGTVADHIFLSRQTVEEAVREQSWAEDQVFGWCRYGLGVGLDSDAFPAPTPTTFHWGGYGGAFLTMDLDSGISCGYTPNGLIVTDDIMKEARWATLWSTVGTVTQAALASDS
jgi:CubicO group peptidase (beta-lactamase class C family)